MGKGHCRRDRYLVYNLRRGRLELPWYSRSSCFPHKQRLDKQESDLPLKLEYPDQRRRFEEHMRRKRLLRQMSAFSSDIISQVRQETETVMGGKKKIEKRSKGETPSGAKTDEPSRTAPIWTIDLSPLAAPGKPDQRLQPPPW